jgi:hypothetical protein
MLGIWGINEQYVAIIEHSIGNNDASYAKDSLFLYVSHYNGYSANIGKF